MTSEEATSKDVCPTNATNEYIQQVLSNNTTTSDYIELLDKSIEMDPDSKISIKKVQTIPGNGWCFYQSVLGIYHNPDISELILIRKFAQAITWCIMSHLKNIDQEQMKRQINTNVNGIDMTITVDQLIKLISIPNLSDKQFPCVYPELDQFIGQAAAYILNKNIIVYDQEGDLAGKFYGTDSTSPSEQIYLLHNGNHFDVILEFDVIPESSTP